ncbi:MAG: GAF domain-containing protein, partial [Bacteroidota bacterium]
LVHSVPLSIRFRLDEKKFDVDGDYNIRYAILKKRIDKAFIKGTHQRLTQSGKVVVVYSQEKDREEYQKYFQYLRQKKMIEDHVEEVELSKLQGVKGLKAFRLTVSLPLATELRDTEESN